MHAPTGTVIEVDDAAHFTSFRLDRARALPPRRARSGSTSAEHEALCREWCARTDRLDRGLAAKGFGFGGRQRERAYHDALRDLAVPAMGHPPVIRIAAVDGDGAAAYARHREALLALSGFLRLGSCSSVAETLIVEQRPHLTRTL